MMTAALIRSTRPSLVICLIAVAAAGCGPDLPDDLDALTTLMNSNNQTISVNASNKVMEVYGKDGLLVVLKNGEAVARSKAAQRLVSFPDPDVEDRLIDVVRIDPDAFVRSQALRSLAKLGSAAALPIAQAATKDPDQQVSYSAKEAVAGIQSRVRR